MSTISVVVPTYDGVFRLERLLESVAKYDPGALTYSWTVFEDPSHIETSKSYLRICEKYGLGYERIPTWSNMHGAARFAFDRVKSDWALYLGDDCLITPGCLTTVLRFVERNNLRTVALVQPAYWNAHDLSEVGYGGNREYNGPPLLRHKDDMYTTKMDEWLPKVPRNPHWENKGRAIPYVNVNGVGFACHMDTYRSVGGFAEGTWCLDESISVRTWLKSDRGIVCLPGPPIVHYFAGSSVTGTPAHDLHTHEAWTQAMGMSKKMAGELCYEKMAERSAAIQQEMKNAQYN